MIDPSDNIAKAGASGLPPAVKVLIGLCVAIALMLVAVIALAMNGDRGSAEEVEAVATAVPAPSDEPDSSAPMINPAPPAGGAIPEATPPVPGAYPGGGGPRPDTAEPLPTYKGRYSGLTSAHLLSPSGNIGCDFNDPNPGLRGDQGLCGIVSYNTTSSPLGSERLGGQQKGKWTFPLAENRFQNPTASSGTTGWMNQPLNDGYQVPVAEYGKQYYFQNWVCASEESGMTCWNTDTGSGVFLSRENVERFEGPAAQDETSQTSAGAGADIVFGSMAPNGRGLGESRPGTVYYGSDPTGRVMDVTWNSWGGDRAEGSGLGNWREPGVGTFENPAEIVAFDRGLCNGKAAYRKATIYFPNKGESFDPANHVNICFTDR